MKLAYTFGAIFLTFSSAFSAVTAAAESATSADVYTPTWSFEGTAEMINIQSEQADMEGIDTSAFALGLYAHYNKNSWVTSLRSSFISYSDNKDFSQTVEIVGGFDDGDIESRSSDASAITLGVASGKMWRFGEERKTAALLQLGYDHLFASERTISGCSNCYSEDIDVDGGVFVQGVIKHNTSAVSIGLSLTQYLGGDGLANRIGITIGSKF